MDFEKRATEALENLDAPYNELLLRLRNFCMVRGIVLKQKDVSWMLPVDIDTIRIVK